MDVELLRVTERPEELIAQAYGICTGKDTIPYENIQRWIKQGHLSPLEHAVSTFRIEGISRSCLAQLTRHRLASYSVESMRYCYVGENAVVLPNIQDDLNRALVVNSYENAFFVYEELVASGVPKESARFVLPLATTTRLIMTANFREWRHIIRLRTHPSAQWEIRGLMEKICYHLKTVAPNVFRDLWATIKGYEID